MESSPHIDSAKAMPLFWRVRRFFRICWDSIDFLSSNESYTWASAIAFNSLITFFPLLIFSQAFLREFGHPDIADHMLNVFRGYFPVSTDFIIRNIRAASANMDAASVFSVFIVAITAIGIFPPIEIALNRVWRVERDRHWMVSWVLSYVMTFACTLLAAIPVMLSWWLGEAIRTIIFFVSDPAIFLWINRAVFRLIAIPFTVAVFFVCYWILPARKMHLHEALPAAIFTGIVWEIGREVYALAIPLFDFEEYYGPFFISVSLVTFALFSALLMLFGAYLTSRDLLPRSVPIKKVYGYLKRKRERPPEPQP